MKVQSSYICLNDMRFYAYHGVLPQERRVGGWYTVTLRVGFNVEKAMSSDAGQTHPYAVARAILNQADWEKYVWIEEHGSLDGFPKYTASDTRISVHE